jgi:hypothetical protein
MPNLSGRHELALVDEEGDSGRLHVVVGRPTSVFLKHLLMSMVLGWFKPPLGLS